MSNFTKLMQQSAAGAGGGGGLDVSEVFSTYLYTGNGSTQTITNGIDLAGEGGLVWLKERSLTNNHMLFDTERGVSVALSTNNTGANNGPYTNFGVTSYNSSGFSIGSAYPSETNDSGQTYASWTFRKAAKFFDCVTWTGDGTGARTISHDLNTSNIGSIIIKKTSGVEDWYVMHRSATNGLTSYGLLNQTSGFFSTGSGISNVTSTTFDVSSYYNGSGAEWVAYLFAHNDGDGDFGDGTQDIIKCGTCSGESGSNRDIDLGFEPQFIITKAVDAVGDWRLLDTMRGWLANPKVDAGYLNSRLEPNTSDAETGDDTVYIKPNGFYVNGLPGSGNYIYIAIRRGPMAVPTDATEVFAMDTLGGTLPNPPSQNAGFPVDLGIMKSKTSSTDPWRVGARLTGQTQLRTNSTNAEITDTAHKFDYQDGWYDSGTYVDSQYHSWMWKRAPSFCDVVAYTGNSNGSTPTQTLTHNLGVKPEMMWVKSRGSSQNWYVFHKDVWDATNNYYLRLNITGGEGAGDGSIFPADVTDTQFTVSERWEVNQSGVAYIAYLFASLDGISKCGSYTGDGTTDGSKVIDCGFTTGARFVLIKRVDAGGSWYVWDTARGIVAADDPRLELNSTNAEVSFDNVDPHSSGFSVVGSSINNINGATYIFYAIA